MSLAPRSVDVAIVGGGLVGASLALALEPTGLRVALIEGVAPEAAVQPSFDDRTTALGNGTRRVFEALGVWSKVAASAAPIRHIHVSDAGRYGFARLEAAEHGIEAFGYVVTNRVLGAALQQRLSALTELELRRPARCSAVTLGSEFVRLETSPDAPPLQARLVVAADGANSLVRSAAG
jgi:2-octaprenyl-6-methoxyphenol hydroxylase